MNVADGGRRKEEISVCFDNEVFLSDHGDIILFWIENIVYEVSDLYKALIWLFVLQVSR